MDPVVPVARVETEPARASELFPTLRNLESSRTHWQYGAWNDLAALSPDIIERDPDRAKLSVLVAAAHSHLGDMAAARAHAKRAVDWGCDRRIVARVLISAVENSLGRSSAAMGDHVDAKAHFQRAIELVESRADTRLLAHTRQIREYARMGLLKDAYEALDAELKALMDRPDETGARMKILQSELQILKHELTLSLQRGQIKVVDGLAGQSPNQGHDIKNRAVSQLGQDLWVIEKTEGKRGGYFVEFGATDGVLLSNSWLLETDFGWKGICAEPNPKFHEDLKRNRRCIVSDACIGARTGETVEFILADVYGVIAQYAEVDSHKDTRAAYRAAGEVLYLNTISLEDFLLQHKAPREIDYLSIDTEGSEYDILAAFPFGRWTIRYITVEHNFTPLRDKIKDLLEGHGYIRTEAKWDDWYELRR
ncbi:MAG: FkbM family methyltransferase [Paracoccaceae bacterium]